MDAVVRITGAEPWSATGSGPRGAVGVIVVHDFAGSPVSTRPLGQALAAAGYAVEVALLPGHGTVYRELAETRYPDWYGALERVLDHLAGRVGRVVVIGHGAGGTLALELACRRAESVDAVVVINPLVLDPTPILTGRAAWLGYLVPFVPRRLVAMPQDDLALPSGVGGSYRMVSTRALQSLVAALPEVRARLAALEQPLLVVRSNEDHVVGIEGARALPGLVGSRDIRELVCERSYHLPQIDYDATLVEDGVRDFLADVVPV